MGKLLDQGHVTANDLRGLVQRIYKKDKFRSLGMLILGVIILAAIVAAIVTKLCLNNCCADCCGDDESCEDGCDENGCSYTTDEDFER